MKRFILTLTVLLSLISMSSFAAGDDKVSAVVLESFKSSFKDATEVEWKAKENLYQAQFTLNGQYISAYYDAEGKMIAMTRNISTIQLPIGLQTSLRSEADGYWISDLFEVSNEDGTSYYVTLENADTKLILKSSSHNDWTNFQKQRKA
jgi:hypothetical protein